MTNVDLTPVVQALAGLVLAAMLAAARYVVPVLITHLKLQVTDSQRAAVLAACESGADLAYKFIVDNGATFAHVPIRNVAIAQGMSYVVSRMPDTLKTLGLTTAHVTEIVTAKLGARYVDDQGISIAPTVVPALKQGDAVVLSAPAGIAALTLASPPSPTVSVAPAPQVAATT